MPATGDMRYIQRREEFRGPIGDLALNNECVYSIIERYARGQIVTKEEALSQMVIQLAHDWSARMKEAYRLAGLEWNDYAR